MNTPTSAMRLLLSSILCLVTTACATTPTNAGGNRTPGEDAQGHPRLDRARIATILDAVSGARAIVELLGLVPEYDCGEASSTFVGKVAKKIPLDYDCAAASTQPLEAGGDELVIDFGDKCEVGKLELAGRARFRYAGGEDRTSVSLDVAELELNGGSLDAEAGYFACSDENTWSVRLTVPDQARRNTVVLDLDVATRAGAPLVGSTTLVFDGTGGLESPDGRDTLGFSALEYQVGNYLPKEGALTVTTHQGREITIRCYRQGDSAAPGPSSGWRPLERPSQARVGPWVAPSCSPCPPSSARAGRFSGATWSWASMSPGPGRRCFGRARHGQPVFPYVSAPTGRRASASDAWIGLFGLKVGEGGPGISAFMSFAHQAMILTHGSCDVAAGACFDGGNVDSRPKVQIPFWGYGGVVTSGVRYRY